MGLVEKEIRKYMLNTPYDQEDFLHDAYEAALLAAEVSNRKGISFSTAFWRLFKKTAFRVSPCSIAKRRIGVSMSVFDCQEYSDDVYYGGETYLPDPEITILSGSETAQAEEVLFHLMERLMPVEENVIVCICGLDGASMSLTETAQALGMSKGAVHQAFRRIMKKALLFRQELVSAGRPPHRGSCCSMKQKESVLAWSVLVSTPLQAMFEGRSHHGTQGSNRCIRNTFEDHRTHGAGRVDLSAPG